MLNKRLSDVFTVIGVVATVASVAVGIYYGQKALRSPGVVVQGIDELVASQDRQSSISEEIRDAVTPVDEIAALSARGYAMDGQSFFRALSAGDVISLELFCSAHASPIRAYIVNFDGRVGSPEIVRVLKDCSFIDLKSICALPIEDIDTQGRPRMSYKEETAIALCGRPAYEAAHARLEKAASDFDARTAIACQEKRKEFSDRHEKWGGHSPTAQTDQIYLRSTPFGQTCARLGIEF